MIDGLNKRAATTRELSGGSVEKETGRPLRVLLWEGISQAEHELQSVAERLSEEQKEAEVSRQVDAREKGRERVVDEEVLVEHELGLIGDQHVRDGEWHLADEEDEHDGDQHECDVAVEACRCAELSLSCADLHQLVDDQCVHADQHYDRDAKHEWDVEIDAEEFFDPV